MEHAASILVADSDPAALSAVAESLRDGGHEVDAVQTCDAAWRALISRPFDLVLSDVRMADPDGTKLLKRIRGFDEQLQVLLLSAVQHIPEAVQGMKEGARDYIEKPVDPVRLQQVVEHVITQQRLEREAQARADSVPTDFHGLVGSTAAMQLLFRTIERVARYDTPVLVVGESGVGKELVARAIHAESRRKSGPYVAFNAASVTDTLFESTLFGHKRGAFTGATADQEGLFESADRGTLVLDEIGEMSLQNQAKLLRVLETREVRPVGRTQARKVDIRFVACTNADLSKLMAEAQFREDLFYRLRGVVLEIPPLRERVEDIPALALWFLERCKQQHDLNLDGFEPEVMRRFLAHRWPGNVRELRHTVLSAAVLAQGRRVHVEDLPSELRAATDVGAPIREHRPSTSSLEIEPTRLAEVERAHVRKVLRLARGNKSQAARLLGVSRHTLYRLIEKHGIDA